MNFNSVEFLIFLPVVLLLYFIVPHKFRWLILLVASYYFYMSWNAWLIFLILGTTLVSYLAAILIDRTEKKNLKKLYLIVTLVVCLGVLAFFKYFNFLLSGVIDFLNLFRMNLNDVSLNIILPVGISFYTFQTLSYVIDVYRGTSKAEKHFGYYALFVCYFPQLVAGPIERPGDLLPQLKEKHDFSWDNLFCGLRIMLVGFFYKCVVADFFAVFVDNVFGNAQEATGLSVLIASALFIIQMYCDFAGYSEIATGAARMMGVKLTRNFNRPYLSVSYTEFFRRWHITLNRWFTDYVYIPLGGNRKGKVRKIINTFVVFLLCGLWHGANWTYVLWGAFAAVVISMESVLKNPIKNFLSGHGIDVHGDIVTLLRRIVFWAFLATSGILFRSTSVEHAGEMFVKLFTAWNFKNGFLEASLGNLGIGVFSILQIVLCIVCLDRIFFFGEYGREREEDVLPLAEGGTLADGDEANRSVFYVYVLLAIAFGWIALLSAGDSSAFAYFQF